MRRRWRRPALRLGVRQRGGLRWSSSGLVVAGGQGRWSPWWEKGGGEAEQPSAVGRWTRPPACAMLVGRGMQASGPELGRARHPQAALKDRERWLEEGARDGEVQTGGCCSEVGVGWRLAQAPEDWWPERSPNCPTPRLMQGHDGGHQGGSEAPRGTSPSGGQECQEK